MSSRPLKSIGAGKLQEFTLSEENYLAYQSGLHLAGMDSSDCSALTRVDLGGNTVGTFTNTFFDDSSTTSPLTLSSTLSVSMVSTSGTNTHTNTISGGGLPETIYVDDIIEINVQGTTSSSDGSTFESISYSVATSGTAGFTSTISGTPTPTIINDEETVWQDNASGLSGSYNATFRYTIESTGSLNIVINSNSIDNDNSNASASDQLVLNTIEVQPARPPATIEQETDLFQNTEAVSPIQNEGALKKNPVYWRKTNGSGIKEMSDTELDVLAERLIRTIVSNEMPGVFRLQDGQPDSTYVKFLENIFADTRQDGSTNYYHIWMKQSGTSPAKLNPISILRQNSLFAGIREMTDAEMQFTFGERIKKVIMDTGIGTYQLRSSSQGAPTALGTWVARGTALDTRKTFLDDPGYTSALNYEKDYTGEYVPTYETSYSSEYILDYTSEYSSDYSATFQGLYISEYTGDYTGEYNTEFAENYIDIYSGSYIDEIYTGDFTLGYTGDYETIDESEIYGTSFEGTPYSTEFVAVFVEDFYTGDYISLYTSEYVADYASDYSSSYEGAEYVSSYEDIYTGDYSSEYAAGFSSIYSEEIYTGNYQEDYLTEYSSDYETLYNTVYVGNYERIESELYTGDYTGEVTEDYTGDYEREIPETFTGDYERDSLEEYVGNYISADSAVYTGEYERIDTDDYTGDYTGEIDEVYTGGYESDVQENYTGEYQRLDPETYTGNYEFDVLENYSTAYGGEVTEDYTGDYSGFYASDYTGSYDAIYSGDYLATYITEYVETINYLATYVTDYETAYATDYSEIIAEDYTGTYVGTVDVPYTSSYITDFLGDYETNYEGIYEGDFSTTYVGTYVSTYESVTDFQLIQNTYVGSVGSYIGTEPFIGGEYIAESYLNETLSGGGIGGGFYTGVGGQYDSHFYDISYLGPDAIYDGDTTFILDVPTTYQSNYVIYTGDYLLEEDFLLDAFYEGIVSYDSEYEERILYEASAYQSDYVETSIYESIYEASFTSNILDRYLVPYTGTFSVNYSSEGSYITFYQTDYTGDYLSENIYTGDYSSSYLGPTPYATIFAAQSAYAGDDIGYEQGDYEGAYTGDYLVSYGGTPYTGAGDIETFEGELAPGEPEFYDGNYDRTYVSLSYDQEYVAGSYISVSPEGYENLYISDYQPTEQYLGNYGPADPTNYVSDYEGPKIYNNFESGVYAQQYETDLTFSTSAVETAYTGPSEYPYTEEEFQYMAAGPYAGTLPLSQVSFANTLSSYNGYELSTYDTYSEDEILQTYTGLAQYGENRYEALTGVGYTGPNEFYGTPFEGSPSYQGPTGLFYSPSYHAVYATTRFAQSLSYTGGYVGSEEDYTGQVFYTGSTNVASEVYSSGYFTGVTGTYAHVTEVYDLSYIGIAQGANYAGFTGTENYADFITGNIATYVGAAQYYNGTTDGLTNFSGDLNTGTISEFVVSYVSEVDVQIYTGDVISATSYGDYIGPSAAEDNFIQGGPESPYVGPGIFATYLNTVVFYNSSGDGYDGNIQVEQFVNVFVGSGAVVESYEGTGEFYDTETKTYQSEASYNVEYVEETYTGPTTLNYAGYTGVGGPDSTYYAQFLRSGPVFVGGGPDAGLFTGGTYIQGEPDYYQAIPTVIYAGASVDFAGYSGNQFAIQDTGAGYYANYEGPIYVGAVLNFAGYTGAHGTFLGGIAYTGPTNYTANFLNQYLATSVSFDGFLDNTETYGFPNPYTGPVGGQYEGTGYEGSAYTGINVEYLSYLGGFFTGTFAAGSPYTGSTTFLGGGFEGAETGQYVGIPYGNPNDDGFVGPVYIDNSAIISSYTALEDGILMSYESGSDFPAGAGRAGIEQESVDYLSAVTSNYDTTSIYAGVSYEPNYVAISYVQTNFNSYTGSVVHYDSDITDFAGDYLVDYLTAANYLSGADINYVSEYVDEESTNYEGVVDEEVYTGDDLNYSEDYTGNYETDTTYTGDYTADYVVEVGYTTDYSGDYEGSFNTDYSGNYEAEDDIAQYLTSGNYIGDYSVNYSEPVNYETEFIGAYQSTVFEGIPYDGPTSFLELQYLSNYLTYTGNYSQTYVGDTPFIALEYEGGSKFTGPSSIPFTGPEPINYAGFLDNTPQINYAGYLSSVYDGSQFEGGLAFAGYTGPGLNFERNEINNYGELFQYIEVYGGDYTGPPSYDGTSYTGIIAYEASFNSDLITQGEESVYESPALVYVATEEIPQEETYTGNYEGNYETDYLTDYEVVDETENYASDGSGYEAVDETETYVSYVSDANYLGDYGSISEENYTGDYEGAEAEVYIGNYESNYETFYTGTYLTDAEELYTGEYEGEISEDYTGDYGSIVEENYTGNYERSDPDSYTGDYVGEISEEYVSEYGSEQTEPFTGNYIGIVEENYTGEYQSVIEETYTGDYERTDEEIYTGEYTGEVLEDYSTDYATDYTSSYEDIYTGDYEGDYEQDFTGDYGSEYTSDYLSDYATDYDSGYTGTYTSVYTGDYSGNYESEYESIYESEFIQDYTGEFVVEYVPDYTIRYGTEYSTSYEGDSFSLSYESDYIANEYEGDYETTFIPYSGFYEATSPETYSGGVDLEFYIGDYTGQDYTGDYEATFTGPIYIGDYIDEYEGESQPENYIGSYEGTTVYGEETELVGTPTVIETYTLYVRID